MSKTIYYFGAGTSYGKRDKQGYILEGIPVVAEIAAEFSKFREVIETAEIPQNNVNFHDLYEVAPYYIRIRKNDLLSDTDSLLDGIKEHTTIDTYVIAAE